MDEADEASKQQSHQTVSRREMWKVKPPLLLINCYMICCSSTPVDVNSTLQALDADIADFDG